MRYSRIFKTVYFGSGTHIVPAFSVADTIRRIELKGFAEGDGSVAELKEINTIGEQNIIECVKRVLGME